jgi:predicted transcriptional regulator
MDPQSTAAGGEPAGSRRRAGELSGLVLEILRTAGAALTPAEMQQRLTAAGAGPLAYTTVVTILSRLHDQGIVERFRTGRTYAYLAVADSALAAQRMRRVLEEEHDRDAVLASFVHTLSPGDEHRLRELLGDLDTQPGSHPDAQAGDR